VPPKGRGDRWVKLTGGRSGESTPEDEFDRALAHRVVRLVTAAQAGDERLVELLHPDHLRPGGHDRGQVGQVNRDGGPGSGLADGERVLVVRVIGARPHPLLVQVLVRDKDDQIPARLDHPDPVPEPLERVSEVLQAVGADEEVKPLVRVLGQELGVPVLAVELGQGADEREQAGEPPERVRAAADVETVADEVMGREPGGAEPPGDGLATLVQMCLGVVITRYSLNSVGQGSAGVGSGQCVPGLGRGAGGSRRKRCSSPTPLGRC